MMGSNTFSAGDVVTTGGAVISVGSSAVVVSNPANGQAFTSAIVPAPAAPNPTAPPSVGVIFGITISASMTNPSVAVVYGQAGTQSLTVGGNSSTLFDNQVATLAPTGLVIAAPNGVVATFSVPSPSPTEVAKSNSTSVVLTSGGRGSADIGLLGSLAFLGLGLFLGFC